MGLSIFYATDADAVRWDEYVAAYARARGETCNHAFLYWWAQIFSQVFGHRPFYIGVERDGKIVGVLPLSLVSSVLFGRSLISVPYLNAGGPLADDGEALALLLNEVTRQAAAERVKYVELRAAGAIAVGALEGVAETLHLRTHKVAMRLPLTANPEQMFNDLPAKLRSQVRKPSKAGFIATRFSGTSENALEQLYQVFSRNMRDLGTPVYPRKLFVETGKRFGDRSGITVVSRHGSPAAAAMTIAGCDTVEVLWASSLRAYNHESPNMLLYWELIKQAIEQGYSEFDFGRSSKDSGTYRFKEQWGAKPHQLMWYYLGAATAIPDINPKNSKFSLMVDIWRRLPLPLANTLGPVLTKSLP